MATTQADIRGWLNEAKKMKATHVIVVCDTFDWEDYPVYVASNEDVRKKYSEYNGPNMQKVMEVYSLKIDIESQLNERRAFHFD
ncbi:MAG: hypothetical protein HYT62_01580 [Candidatus Yanofskybacteria bacterium]|nr:hypothetical protein [Candidatus Yanofskybacteria bacterium]